MTGNIEIPRCYKRPLSKWLRTEYRTGKISDERLSEMMLNAGLFLLPAVTPTHIVFAVVNKEQRMARALKLEREHDKDAEFINTMLDTLPRV